MSITFRTMNPMLWLIAVTRRIHRRLSRSSRLNPMIPGQFTSPPRSGLTASSLAIIATALLACSPARAQVDPASVRLNDPTLASQYLNVDVKTTLQGTGAYTLEAWIRPTSFAGFPTIIGNDYRTGYWLGLNTAGRVRFYPRGGAFVDTPNPVPLNTWTHVAATYDPVTGYAIYVNGVTALSGGTLTGPATTSVGDLRIGADREGGAPAYFWRGNLDEVRIWQGAARTPAQIAETMYQGAGRPFMHSALYSTLQGNWDMQNPYVSGFFDRACLEGVEINEAECVGGDIYAMRSDDGAPVAFNQGVEFNGSDTYGVLRNMSDGFDHGLTIEAWVCPYSFNGSTTIVGRSFTTSFWLGLGSTGRVRFYPRGGVGGYFETTTSLPLNVFSHVAATYRDGFANIYVNGRMVASSTAFTGPVGENGGRVWVGADSSASGPIYAFRGIIDQVSVVQGACAAWQIIQDMHLGWSGYSDPERSDERLVSRPKAMASYDGFGDLVYGTNARLVRSSAPLLPPLSMEPLYQPLYQIDQVVGGVGLTLTDNPTATYVGTDMYVGLDRSISSLSLFVSASTRDLAAVRVRLISPLGTAVDVVVPGDGRGRELHTVFSDESSFTLATGDLPYQDGVAPSQPLSTFNGQNSLGFWRIELTGTGVALNGWGLNVNNARVADAPGAANAGALRLRNEGGSTVRGQGRLAFDLPRAGHVELDLLDVQGRQVLELARGERPAGEHHATWSTSGVAPGVYFARLTLDHGESRSARVIVLE